jgi:hypothetical protein
MDTHTDTQTDKMFNIAQYKVLVLLVVLLVPLVLLASSSSASDCVPFLKGSTAETARVKASAVSSAPKNRNGMKNSDADPLVWSHLSLEGL